MHTIEADTYSSAYTFAGAVYTDVLVFTANPYGRDMRGNVVFNGTGEAGPDGVGMHLVLRNLGGLGVQGTWAEFGPGGEFKFGGDVQFFNDDDRLRGEWSCGDGDDAQTGIWVLWKP